MGRGILAGVLRVLNGGILIPHNACATSGRVAYSPQPAKLSLADRTAWQSRVRPARLRMRHCVSIPTIHRLTDGEPESFAGDAVPTG